MPITKSRLSTLAITKLVIALALLEKGLDMKFSKTYDYKADSVVVSQL